MLGRTARFLRLFGYDTLYSNTYSDPELLRISSEENRVLLTRDVELHHQATKRTIPSFLIIEKSHIAQLTNIFLNLELELNLDPSDSRCTTCNAIIIPIPKEKVTGKLPEKTFATFDEYWICSRERCGKFYYQGPHWIQITAVCEQIKGKINEKKDE